MNAIAPITVRPIQRPQYATAETFDAWIRINAELVHDYWSQLQLAIGQDPDHGTYADVFDFAKCQYDLVTSAAEEDGEVADCDVCQYRPGTHTVVAAGCETWTCDKCSDITEFSTANVWQDRDADDAGVPMYGEI
jgi:hypothetical protein